MKASEKTISFLPIDLLEWIEQGKIEHSFPAVVAFADVSGFTTMSEQLAAIGKEGAEALTNILNNYFTTMINRIQRGGGFVGKFGGDAMTIFFPADDQTGLVTAGNRALDTCIELQALMDQFQAVETKAGTFSMGMKIGISDGQVLFKVVGDDQKGKEFLLAGDPLDQAAEAEHHGVSGEVVVTPHFRDLCDVEGDVLDDGFVRLHLDCEPRTTESDRTAPSDETVERWAQLAKPFIDRAIYYRLQLGLDSVGEIRRVSVIFMSFSGLDYDNDPKVNEKLDTIFNWVNGLVWQYGGSINKVDMGDKGSKMILTFGAPTAQENDAERAVHCGFELVSRHTCNVA